MQAYAVVKLMRFSQTWEPTLQYLLRSLKGIDVAEIWLWQSVNHGDAAIINANNLCGLCKFSQLKTRATVPNPTPS